LKNFKNLGEIWEIFLPEKKGNIVTKYSPIYFDFPDSGEISHPNKNAVWVRFQIVFFSVLVGI
jgi:hypothetical protein